MRERKRTAGIVLAGGRSRRMGAPKATLEWHGSTLVGHTAGLVARVVDGPVVVVRAAGQDLPPLPATAEIADDDRDDRGPLQGLAAGLAQIGDRASIVYLTGVDAPLLHPAFVRHVVGALGAGHDVALPRAHGHAQPLAAAYRTTITPILADLLAHDRLATKALLARLRAREISIDELLADVAVATHDPELDSLLNLNTPDAYEAACAKPAPAIAVRVPGRDRPLHVRAATLANAARAAGVTLGPDLAAILEGHGTVADPHEPLVAGDRLTFENVHAARPRA